MRPETADSQVFTVTIQWSPESEARLTEGDIQEAIEQLVMDFDEEAVVTVTEEVLPDV
ncbi:MAG: hypothetical protein QHI38_09465 [Armatimonadota bacterium]|nr:hypothetical protein [Armatimonadota bacterium]